jgi:hypothetical protein
MRFAAFEHGIFQNSTIERTHWRKLLRAIGLLILGPALLADLPAGAAERELDLRPPSPAQVQQYHEEEILRALHLSCTKKNAFYFVFLQDHAACNDAAALVFLDVGEAGIMLRFFTALSKAELRVDTEKKVETATLERAACVLEFAVAKEIKVYGDRTRVNPRLSADLVPFEAKQAQALSKPSKHPWESLRFSFATGDFEACPRGASFGDWWKTTLLFFFGDRDHVGEVEPRESSPYESRFDFTRGDCRYVIAVSLYGKSEDGFSPLRVRDLQSKGLN